MLLSSPCYPYHSKLGQFAQERARVVRQWMERGQTVCGDECKDESVIRGECHAQVGRRERGLGDGKGEQRRERDEQNK